MSRIEHKSPYGPRRAAAYQKPTDQIDAIYKGFVAIRDANIPGRNLLGDPIVGGIGTFADNYHADVVAAARTDRARSV